MEQTKKEDIGQKAKDWALKMVIAEYPRDELKLKTFYESSSDERKFVPPPSIEQEKDYQKFYEEKLKKLDNEETAKRFESKKSEELENADMHDAARKAWATRKDNEIKELTDTLKRLQAEFENYKKRAEKERIEFVKYAQAELMLKLLPLLDTFEIALKNTKDSEKFVKGMEMVYAQFYSVLEQSGIRPINATGQKFDPYKHEVLIKEESDKDEDIVLDELQKGYMLYDKVLRHSKVKISSIKQKSKG